MNESGNVNNGFSGSECDMVSPSKDPLNTDPTKPNSFVEGDKKLKRTIMKNVILIAIAFMVLFTSFQSMASLQSSINQAIIYYFLTFPACTNPNIFFQFEF